MDTSILIQQLGTALPMMGAHSLTDMGADGFRFKIRGSAQANAIVIKLDPSDTYTVQAWKCRGVNWKLVGESSGVYCDNLHAVLESLTGLYTRL